MIAALSTSSPVASVALMLEEDDGCRVVWSGREEAAGRASSACLALLDRGLHEVDSDLASIDRFVADVGPGSFTGVRVGVTLAKVLAYCQKGIVAGVSAFDLISAQRCAVIPNRKSEWLIRLPGHAPRLWCVGGDTPDLGLLERVSSDGPVFSSDARGYGRGFQDPTYPDAARGADVWSVLRWIEPERLIPDYIVGPSISQPKRPFSSEHGRG